MFPSYGCCAKMEWSKTRILLVHSDIRVRRWVHDILHRQKVASVQSTRSAATGLDLLKRFAADVAVVQLRQPEMTAVDFVARLPETAHGPMPVLVIVDNPNDGLLGEAADAGVAGVIPRPTTAEDFLERVAAAITAPQRLGSPKPSPTENRPFAASAAATTAATREQADTPAGQGIEPVAPPAERPSVPLVETAAEPAARHSAEDWTAAVAPTGQPPAKPPQFDPTPAVSDHEAWLRSRGREGKRASFDGVDLHGQSLCQVNLASASLRDADLSDADCRSAILTSADLRRADLSGADLSGANLSVANLRGATLRLTKLSEASLRGADLAGACLTDAAMAATDFAGANLLDADLRRSDLTWAVGLTQPQIDKARADNSTRMPLGIRLPEIDE